MMMRMGIVRKALRAASLKLFYKLDNNNNIDFATNGERFFLKTLFDLFSSTMKGKVILFDIGANIGDYAQMLLDKSKDLVGGAEIHIFEPMQASFTVLSKSLPTSRNVILNRKAVSDTTGTAPLYYDSQRSALASLYRRNLAAFSLELDKSEVAETIRLDQYVEEHSINHIHFMKIDIEGHEAAAFAGMGKYLNAEFIDFLQFEYGGTNLDSHTSLMDLYALFEKAGFKVAKMMPRGLDVRSYSPWMDNFQYANYVALSPRINKYLK